MVPAFAAQGCAAIYVSNVLAHVVLAHVVLCLREDMKQKLLSCTSAVVVNPQGFLGHPGHIP